uniref:Uncharacterized protein n=1 Tax=Thermogemmatispora argillosa TaxID=2045280 RepID=A0A455SZF9_9CHLR|nr:hypothetical protein KTA_11570 [Thermogemmatispora argillosa]
MLEKGHIEDIEEHSQTRHATLLDRVQALLKLSISCSMAVSQATIEEKRSQKSKMSFPQRGLEGRIRLNIILAPLLRIVGAKEQRRNAVFPALLTG